MSRREHPVTSTVTPDDAGVLGELHRDRLAPTESAPSSVSPLPEKDVEEVRTRRMTLDVREEDRRRLDRWSALAGVEIGRPRLGSAAVLRAVIEALTDPERQRPEVEAALKEVLADREHRGLNTGA